MIKNTGAALALFLFAVYLLTASGHTYSPDEESLVYVTQSFVRRGEFDIPNPDKYPVTGGHRGVGGRFYSGTGLGQSLLAVPLYVAGDQAAGLLEPRFRPFIVRLVMVSLLNALVTALTGLLLFAWLRRLRFSPRVSAALVLVYGLSTMAWIYARTFYSEPLLTFWFVLSGYAICRFGDSRQAGWMFVGGLAAGLAILTKVQGVLVLPALAVYYLALEFRRERNLAALVRTAFAPGLVFVAALSLGVVLTGYYDVIRFGDPLQTGRGEVAQSFSMLTGLFGLLLSSGKSIFLYAPPAVLFFLALPAFARRRPAEAALCVVLIVTFVLFHSRLPTWSGDGAWGPRYLVSTLPFWLLPLGVSVGGWWRRAPGRIAVVVLVGAGLLVNFLALAINFDTFIQVQPSSNARHFRPADSPLLGEWNLLVAHLGDWRATAAPPDDGVALYKGFLATGDPEPLPRFIGPHATILISNRERGPTVLTLVALDYRDEARPVRELRFMAGGAPLQAQQLPGERGYLSYRVQIPAAESDVTPIDILTLGSEAVGKSPMGDELGVHVQELEVRARVRTLSLFPYRAIPPLPLADAKSLWAWFYEPAYPQFDYYGWYLYFSELPEQQAMLIVAVATLAGVIALALSAPQLVRVLFARGSMLLSRRSEPEAAPIVESARS